MDTLHVEHDLLMQKQLNGAYPDTVGDEYHTKDLFDMYK